MAGVLEKVNGHEYNGVWKLWKLGSLVLFAAFVVAFFDVARTLRHSRDWLETIEGHLANLNGAIRRVT